MGGAASIGPRSPFDHLWVWILVGVCSAALPVLATAGDLQMRYLLYGILGIGLLALTPYVVMLVGSMERIFWILFLLSLQLELAFTPITVAGGKPAGPFGTMITPTMLTALVLFTIWGSARIWGDGERLRIDRGLLLAAGAVFCTAAISMINAAGRTLSIFGLFELLSLTLTAVVASHGCSIRRNIPTLRSALFAVLFVQSVFIIVEQALGVQISLSRGLNTEYAWGDTSEGRFAGTFGAPSTAATYLAVCLLFLFRRMFSKQPPTHATASWALFALGFLALLLTRTRSAWIGFTIGSIGLGWQCFRLGTLSRQMANRLVVGGVLALLLAWPLVAQRLGEDHKGMADTRGNLAWIAVEMIKSHPFAGVGVNTATNQVYSYAVKAGLANNWVFIVHNQFLLVAAETGLPGLAAFLVLMWVGLRAARRCMQSEDTLIAEVGGTLFWSLIAMCWALNIDHVSGSMTYVLLWFLIGAACGLDALRQRESGLLPRGADARTAAAFAA